MTGVWQIHSGLGWAWIQVTGGIESAPCGSPPPWFSSTAGHNSSPSVTEMQESKSQCPTYFKLLLKSYLIKSHWLQQVMWTNPKSRGEKVCSARHKAKASQRPKPRISDMGNYPFMEVKKGRRGWKVWTLNWFTMRLSKLVHAVGQ